MNIVVFVADALRADHLSCYGYHRETTPTLDSLQEKWRWRQYEFAFTPTTFTRSAAASILTGTYPTMHGVKTVNDGFSATLSTLPKQLSQEGFTAYAISAIGNFSSGLGFGEGFHRFIDLYKDASLLEDRPSSTAEKELLEHESGDVVFPRGEDVIDRFESVVLNDRSDPFFSILWTIDPHDPYQPPDGFAEFIDENYDGPIDGSRASVRKSTNEDDFQRLRNLYDSEIRYTDSVFGSLIDTLREYGVYEDTLIVFLGDHGEAFGDHDGNVGHSNIHYEELIHVPLLVRYPEDTPEWDGQGTLVSLIDVMPTILEYLDLDWEPPDPDQVFGRSILDGGKKQVFGETHYSEVQNSFFSVRDKHWKYIELESPMGNADAYLDLVTNVEFLREFISNPLYFLRRRFGGSSTHLYDLDIDPQEQDNIVDERPEVANAYSDILSQWRSTMAETAIDRTSSGYELDAETRVQLQEMGYLDE